MSEVDYTKKPCQHCPFLKSVTPFLHPDRAYEISAGAVYPHNDFPCHKTTEPDENSDCGEMMEVETTKTCAGFLTLRAHDSEEYLPEGFEPAWGLVYEDAYDMEEAYREQWDKVREQSND